MSETDKEFVADMEWLHSHDREAALPPEKLIRLFALARRGAEAADEIERLKVKNIQMQAALGYAICADDERHIIPENPFKCGVCDANKGLRAEIERLRADLRLAVMSDSETCKVLEREVERLLKSRNRWAKKYNDLLAKRRVEDGYDVYAAAREEYRKKIAEQAQEIERLREALRDALSYSTIGDMPVTIYENARAAVGGGDD